jgi:hypothetical protein
MPLLTRLTFDATTSGGEWESTTIQPGSYAMCPHNLAQVLVTSASSDTTFDFIIKDHEDFQIRKWTTATNTFNDLTPTPVVGTVTLRIENASADEAFTILIVFSREVT